MKTVPVRLRIRRTSGWQEYVVQVSPNAYVLDALEAASAQDKSLLFRHSCHHASCGSCGLRINGREALPCITPISKMSKSHGILRLEPLRNFPITGDLLVDLGPFLRRLDLVHLRMIRDTESNLKNPDGGRQINRLLNPMRGDVLEIPSGFNRMENCIECGLCVSACPVVGLDPQYAGPALLAAASRVVAEPRQQDTGAVLRQVDHQHGLWRCHAAFECSEVCPANVDPAREIMGLRSRLLRSSSRRELKDNT